MWNCVVCVRIQTAIYLPADATTTTKINEKISHFPFYLLSLYALFESDSTCTLCFLLFTLVSTCSVLMLLLHVKQIASYYDEWMTFVCVLYKRLFFLCQQFTVVWGKCSLGSTNHKQQQNRFKYIRAIFYYFVTPIFWIIYRPSHMHAAQIFHICKGDSNSSREKRWQKKTLQFLRSYVILRLKRARVRYFSCFFFKNKWAMVIDVTQK